MTTNAKTGSTTAANFANHTIWTGDNLDIMRGMNEERMSGIRDNPDNERDLQERRRIKGAYQVWVEQLQRVNRYYARIESISKGRSDPLHYAANEELIEYEDDDVYSFFVHCYHLVDWIRQDPDYCNCDRNTRCHKDSCPESWLEGHRALRISRDLCIRVKHVGLSDDRTGKPRFATQTDLTPGFPSAHQVEIQWPHKETFFQKWSDIKQCEPDAFGDKSPDQGYKQGYHVSGYEQECWLAAYEKGCREDALEVARQAREDWKQYFLKWDCWTKIFPKSIQGSTEEIYEWWFRPDRP